MKKRRAAASIAVASRSSELHLQKEEPNSTDELLAQLKSLGVEPQDASNLGFRPEVDRSSAVPTAETGASVVSDARALRNRRRGEMSLNGGVDHPAAKELVDKALPKKR
jgi:hypothetical protein